MKHCLICSGCVETFIDFGRMPLGNAFLTAEEFETEYFFNLAAGVCESCFAVQLTDQPKPEKMFHSRYPFFTGSSGRMSAHFEEMARSVSARFLPGSDPFVVEIGSNDGTLLDFFRARNIRHLGVDPSSNVAEAAARKGVQTLCAFFDEREAGKILSEHGSADLILAANVICHIAALHSVLSGIDLLLTDAGVAVFEEPYMRDVLEKTAYDQIYDEHVFLFSLHAVQKALGPHNLELFDAQREWTHGGSMRYFIGRKGARPESEELLRLLAEEKLAGMTRMKTYEDFRGRCEKSREGLVRALEGFKKDGLSAAGYAATSKSTTVLNYAGIGPDLLPYICDTTPEKQGKFTPGVHIPVRPPEAFRSPYPDRALLFAWNHAEEIMAKEKDFLLSGAKWLVYIPHVKTL